MKVTLRPASTPQQINLKQGWLGLSFILIIVLYNLFLHTQLIPQEQRYSRLPLTFPEQ